MNWRVRCYFISLFGLMDDPFSIPENDRGRRGSQNSEDGEGKGGDSTVKE